MSWHADGFALGQAERQAEGVKCLLQRIALQEAELCSLRKEGAELREALAQARASRDQAASDAQRWASEAEALTEDLRVQGERLARLQEVLEAR